MNEEARGDGQAEPRPAGEPEVRAALEVRPFTASREIDKLAEALAAAQAEMPLVERSKTADVTMKSGGHFTYDYADLGDILKATLPVLGRHGLAVIQPPTVEVKGSVTIKTVLLHKSGQWISETLVMPVADATDPQRLGSGMAYARRYAYCGIVGISPLNEDDDGAKAGEKGKGRSVRTGERGESEAGEASVRPTNGDAKITVSGSGGGQKGHLLAILDEHKVDKKAFGEHLKAKYGVERWGDIRQGDYEEIVKLAHAWPHPASAERTPGQEG